MQLTKQQAKKLMKGGAIQVKHSQLGVENLPSDFPPHILKAIHRAMRQGKGMRMKFEPQHLVSGSGIFDWLKSIASSVAQTILPFGKQVAKYGAPIVKQLAPVIAPAISKYTGLPISSEMVSSVADVTGKVAGSGVKRKTSTTKYQLADDSSTIMNPQHPVFGYQPQLPPPGDLTKALHPRQGEPPKLGAGVMTDSSQFINPFIPIPLNYTAGGSFKLGKGMKRGGIQTAGSFRLN